MAARPDARGRSLHQLGGRAQFYDDAPPHERLQKIDQAEHGLLGRNSLRSRRHDLVATGSNRIRLAYADLLARVRLERKHWHAGMIIVENSSTGPAPLDELSRGRHCLSTPEYHALLKPPRR